MIKPSMIQQNCLASPINFRNSHPLLSLRGGSAPPVSSLLATKFDPLIQTIVNGHLKVFTALVLAILLKPVSSCFYDQLTSIFPWDQDNEKKTPTVQQSQDKFRLKLRHIVETVSTAARLFLLIAAFDVFKVTINCLGLRIPKSENLTDVFGWAVYLVWGCRKISALNLYVLKKIMVNTDIINDPRRLGVVHRLLDYALLLFGIFIFYEVLNIEMGYSAKSILAAFSFGTAAIALAMKGIITDFLNGVLLSASDRIFEGDFIEVDGVRQKVNRLGWLETKLRGSDNILYTIPNTQLMSSRLSNLSRVKTCQVRQTLKFPYSDIDKLEKLSFDIKSEIRAACPSIITDGTFPFRCYWTNFGSNYLEVFVNAHFRIPPVGDAYYENRQQCLFAIDRAVRKNGIESYSGS